MRTSPSMPEWSDREARSGKLFCLNDEDTDHIMFKQCMWHCICHQAWICTWDSAMFQIVTIFHNSFLKYLGHRGKAALWIQDKNANLYSSCDKSSTELKHT